MKNESGLGGTILECTTFWTGILLFLGAIGAIVLFIGFLGAGIPRLGIPALLTLLAIVASAFGVLGCSFASDSSYGDVRPGILLLISGLFLMYLAMWCIVGRMEESTVSSSDVHDMITWLKWICMIWSIPTMLSVIGFVLLTKTHRGSAEVLTGDFNSDLQRILSDIEKYSGEYQKSSSSNAKKAKGVS